jgi:hypothetical protein
VLISAGFANAHTRNESCSISRAYPRKAMVPRNWLTAIEIYQHIASFYKIPREILSPDSLGRFMSCRAKWRRGQVHPNTVHRQAICPKRTGKSPALTKPPSPACRNI